MDTDEDKVTHRPVLTKAVSVTHTHTNKQTNKQTNTQTHISLIILCESMDYYIQEPKKLVRFRDGHVVSTKGERFSVLARKDAEGEDMKKTYMNLKPLRKYRFH